MNILYYNIIAATVLLIQAVLPMFQALVMLMRSILFTIFLTKYYAINIKKIFIYLVRTVLPKTATLRTVLMNQSMALENLEERLRAFNSELSPDRAWGKKLNEHCVSFRKKMILVICLKQIREQIQEIDIEANNFVETDKHDI